ncbi:MAG TPA: copper chaperone PCu(A)C [Iamia sp.]|nr:copper chaperone PCu(A)C [Iamia sp.]
MRRALAAVVVVALAACGGGAARAAAPQVAVADAFTTEGTMALAVYLDVENPGGPDRIVGAELVGESAGLARDVSLHQTAERDGLSIMAPTDGIEVAGGTDDALAPAGAHIMLEDLVEPVSLTTPIRLRIDLDRGDDVTVDVRVVTADEATGLLTGGGS